MTFVVYSFYFMYAVGPIFSKYWVNEPYSGNREHSYKLLGMMISDKLDWKEHFYGKNGLISSLNKRLFAIRRVANHIPQDKLILKSFKIRQLSLSVIRSSSTSSLRSTLSTSQTGTTNFRRASGSCPFIPLHTLGNWTFASELGGI